MKYYGIIGYPLTHSFSQQYFNQKFQQLVIPDCRYESFPIRSVGEIQNLVKHNPDLAGLNVTIPYKKQVLGYLTDRSQIPAGLEACNCIKIKKGQLTGYNTDITGLEKSLLPLLKKQHNRALILGNGGAAAAVKFVLQKLKISYIIVSRNIHDDSTLTYADLNGKIISENALIINTTPLGTFPNVEACPQIPYQFLGPEHLLYDLVYNPDKTLFQQKGEWQGALIKNGKEMLIIQAEESWKIWNHD